MPILPLSYNPLYVRLGLISLAVALLFGYLFLWWRRSRRSAASTRPASREGSADPQLFEFSYRPGSSLAAILLRAALLLLALWVAAGLFLIFIPQATIDRMAQALRLRNPPPEIQENIALLYLGDELDGKQFRIRGAIRNISTQPIEKLDAVVRLYAADGTLMETAVVRMDSEHIAPDAVSIFHIAYPDFAGRVSSYAVEFKLRQGQAMPYKDMRGVHSGT